MPRSQFITIQDNIANWLLQTFNVNIMVNKKERAARALEECCELAQSLDFTKEDALAVVEQVYAKEPGHYREEAGDAFFTLFALCAGVGIDAEEVLTIAIQKAWKNQDKIRAKQKLKSTQYAE